jgi:hypothetical protein
MHVRPLSVRAAVPGRSYRQKIRARNAAGYADTLIHAAFYGLTADYSTIIYLNTSDHLDQLTSEGPSNYLGSSTAFQDLDSIIKLKSNLPSNLAWIVAAPYGFATAGNPMYVDWQSITFEDVTESRAALASANAAATSASSAATSNTAAGQSASAAQTSATNAVTSAGQASTSATNASNSAQTAEGHAATASTQANLAAASAGQASGSASAAAGSASTAATHSTNAGNSASAAATSSLSASASLATAIQITRNPDFALQKEFWSNNSFGNPSYWTYLASSYQDLRSNILRTTASTGPALVSDLIPIAPGSSRYKLKLSHRIIDGSAGSAIYYAGLFFFDAAGNLITGSDGTGNYPLGAARTYGNYDWQDLEVVVGRGYSGPNPYGGTVNIPEAAVSVRLIYYANYTNVLNALIELDHFSITDVTSEVNAAASATAAATNASNAATSATAAGSSASAAQTSATNAATSASNASTSATQASTSADTASGHAASAGTSATNAANSASAAGGSASAAAGSASTASTQATNAANSATAAAASQVAAASTYSSTVLIGGNQFFEQGYEGWDYTHAQTVAARGGRANVWYAALSAGRLTTTKKFAFDPSRKYRISMAYWTGAGSTGSQLYAGFVACGADGVELTHNPGSYAYVTRVGQLQAPNAGWVVYTSDVIVPQVPGAVYGYPEGTTSIKLHALPDYNNSGTEWGIDYIRLDDVTEREAADQSASAAATQASNAATSANAAGASATAASSSATAAATSAGNASTFASQASSSANDAQSASTSAGTQASNAAASAASAATQASNASASASSASTSASVAAGVVNAAVNRNSGFDNYPNATGVPTNWQGWWGGETFTRVDDGSGGYALQIEAAANTGGGIVQGTDVGTAALGQSYIWTIEAELVSGSWHGAGGYLATINDGWTLGNQGWDFKFPLDADTTGEVSASKTGRRTWSKFITVTSDPTKSAFRRWGNYVLSHWPSGWTGVDISAANGIKVYRSVVRPATAQEVAAETALPALQASVTTNTAAIVDLEGQLQSAFFEVIAAAGGNPAQLLVRADAAGSLIALVANQLILKNVVGDQLVTALKLIDGKAFFGAPVSVDVGSKRLTLGPGFGVNNEVLLWFGPASTSQASMTRANADFALGSDGNIYKAAGARLTIAAADIPDLTVDTIKIKNAAVTNEVNSFTATKTTLTGTSWKTLQFATLATTGQRVIVNSNFFMELSHEASGVFTTTIRITRSSGSGPTTVYETNLEGLRGDFLTGWQSITFSDTPAANTWTYVVAVKSDVSNFVEQYAHSRFLQLTEFKR